MHVVTTTKALQAVCARLARHPYVAVDTEFLREQTFWPVLCLVQMAGSEDEVIVDPLASGIDLAPFYELMLDPRVTKVFHAGRQDIEIVYNKTGQVPQSIFDTQVAAMVCGFGESVSYVNLVKNLTGEDIDKSSRFTDWSRRPLSDKQLQYALGDVTHLRAIYAKLDEDLRQSGRHPWLQEEMAELADPKTYDTNPEDAWRRLKLRVKNQKALAVLIELAAWRDRVAQAQDVPRARVLRDEALYDVANQMPTEAARLGELRSLSEGFARSARAKEIIEAVRRGLARDPKSVPRMPSGQPISAEAGALVDLLRVLLKATAARNRVAPKMIADSDDLERIATGGDVDLPALKGWRREIFGEDALRLRRGEISLAVQHGKVVTVPSAKSAARGVEPAAAKH